MLVRPETVADYPAIADVHARAFGDDVGVPALVALLRQRAAFDPSLSLVAEIDGRVAGHVLFTPQRLRLLDADAPAVMLSPLGVLPEFQRQGVGSALVQEGHHAAASKGYALAWLIGEPDYYPQFGYRQRAYGTWTLPVDASETVSALQDSAVMFGDVVQLRDLWRLDQAHVDFAFDPGPALSDWVSPNPHIESLVFRDAGQVVGFAMFDDRHQDRPRALLARDGGVTMGIVANLARRARIHELYLPLHSSSAAARGLAAPSVRARAPQMAVSLARGALDEYFGLVAAGRRPLGQTGWTTAVDLAD
jgi:predicted N-acetyltransferase YhbS